MKFWRRLLAGVLLCTLLFTTAGCGLLSPYFTVMTQESPDPAKYVSEFAARWHYRRLSKELQDCYGSLYTALSDGFSIDETVEINGKQYSNGIKVILPHGLADQEQAQALYTAFFYDNPQFFYVNNLYGLEGYEVDGKPQYNKLQFTYLMTVEERRAAKDRFDEAVNDILDAMPSSDDDYAVELYLHETVVDNCTYAYNAAEEGFEAFPHAYSAYGALVEGKAVCEGYARGLQYLFNCVGIDGTPVTGSSLETGEDHMWNVVQINNALYHLDATWNDSDDSGLHNYFNVTTKQISLSHRIGDTNQTVSECTATNDNYYVRNGLYITTYRRQEIGEIIANQIKNGATLVELFIEDSKFESALLFLRNRTAAEEYINPHLAAEGQKLWEYTLYGDPTEHILYIRKK